jgi:hypothetical protein
VVCVPLLNRLIIIASPYVTINDNTSGIPISIYPSMTCLELDRIIPNDNSSKKGYEMQIGM